MSRLPPLEPSALTTEQLRVREEIAAARAGVVGGPFAVWLRVPAIADRANQFGNTLRRDGLLERRLFELLVLVVAANWSAEYAWSVHAEAAASAGLEKSIIDAIGSGRRPEFSRVDEGLAYEFATEALRNHAVADSTYQDAVATLGVEGVIEMAAVIGFYSMVAVTLACFEVGAADHQLKT